MIRNGQTNDLANEIRPDGLRKRDSPAKCRGRVLEALERDAGVGVRVCGRGLRKRVSGVK